MARRNNDIDTLTPKVAPPKTVTSFLEQGTGRGDLIHDPIQLSVARKLDALNTELANLRVARKTNALGWIFAKKSKADLTPNGYYMYGGVGRGKTMLMDQFFTHCPMKRKRRVHFNDFMAEIQDRINAHRQALKNGETAETDPIPPVARDVIKKRAFYVSMNSQSPILPMQ